MKKSNIQTGCETAAQKFLVSRQNDDTKNQTAEYAQ
jgi:hypothetical protein